MYSSNSPLDSLAAFAIVFAAGVLSAVCIAMYIGKLRKDALRGLHSGNA